MQNQLCLWHQIPASAQASRLLACTVWYSLADRMTRPHQNLPVAFFAWFRHISFSYWEWTERSDQKTHHPEKLRFGFEVGKKESEPLVVVLFCVIISIWEMNGGINGWWVGGGVEEIPLSGWNWMASLGIGGRDWRPWCRGCCQPQDSGVFVFSIIACCSSSFLFSLPTAILPFTFTILIAASSRRSTLLNPPIAERV